MRKNVECELEILFKRERVKQSWEKHRVWQSIVFTFVHGEVEEERFGRR